MGVDVGRLTLGGVRGTQQALLGRPAKTSALGVGATRPSCKRLKGAQKEATANPEFALPAG